MKSFFITDKGLTNGRLEIKICATFNLQHKLYVTSNKYDICLFQPAVGNKKSKHWEMPQHLQ